ncbi:pentapeptide repeat-containing protein [Caballeronia sp. LZ034LL]|uniref:pentapeptide repeat-containing protein n=1 Tax=Caballeronia sp. LZ034LL TaxID=3038567 RepID=UPI00285B9996|nr:pentapeptide repeat-containing protein [Caballeronia sp. LZ034LL]MDR5833362.1 pentapeptide repeat-containing protein [Caballeronia sp. LZ034LL]
MRAIETGLEIRPWHKAFDYKNRRTGELILTQSDDQFRDSLRVAVPRKRDLSHIDLGTSIIFGGAPLSDSQLRAACLVDADLAGANLERATIKQGDMRSANLEQAVLVGAQLSGVILCGANLVNAKMAGAMLNGADLTGSNLYGADLKGADLRDCKLNGAILEGANLDGAIRSDTSWKRGTEIKNRHTGAVILTTQSDNLADDLSQSREQRSESRRS